MLRIIRKNSQLTIPKKILDKLKLKEGDTIDIEVEEGKIIITPVEVKPKKIK